MDEAAQEERSVMAMTLLSSEQDGSKAAMFIMLGIAHR